MVSSMHQCVLVSLALLFAPVAGNTFLAANGIAALLDDGDLLKDLSSVVNGSSSAIVEARASNLEGTLRPTFMALPQGPGGRVDAAGVRYLLHRLFVLRHGWFVNGLHNRGDAWNASSPAAVLRDVNGALEQKIDAHLNTTGFTLKQVAVLGAVLESLVHMESVERLRSAYRIAGLSTENAAASEAQVMEVMAIYMQSYVLGQSHETLTREAHDWSNTNIRKVYPEWDATMSWVQELRAEVLSRGVGSPTSFDTTLLVLEEMSERYGRWQNRECIDIKNKLMELEDRGSGRVRLSAFYESALAGNWQFSESKVYLKQSGALDEDDARRPSVIIPNYVNAPSNCIASSNFYSVCCIDECEGLMGQIEQQVASWQAPPGRIAEVVRGINSSSTAAPRILSPALLRRLDDVAEHHGGNVRLHGRLFAQWLHHAFPRECQFPHISGTSSPATVPEFMKRSGESPVADAEAMRWHVQEAKLLQNAPGSASDGVELPWSAEEELFVSRPALETATSALWSLTRGFAMVVAACSMSWMVVKAAFVADPQVSKHSNAKYAV